MAASDWQPTVIAPAKRPIEERPQCFIDGTSLRALAVISAWLNKKACIAYTRWRTWDGVLAQ
eukprot:8675583-Pyramimonas_sp.AAC.1